MIREGPKLWGGVDELYFCLPHHDKAEIHSTKNGTFSIERTVDGGAEIHVRENIHEWGRTEVVRLDADAWKVVQAFVAGGPGGGYYTPYRRH